MTNYVREQSAGDILRNTLTIYKDNFLVLFLIYLLPLFPFLAFQQYMAVMRIEETNVLALVLNLLIIIFSLLLFPPFTVAISEICLGNKASVIHSFRRVIEKGLGGFIGTYFLLVLVVAVGMLLLIIPGIILMIWYMFTLQIAVLERVFGRRALTRSKELGKGCYRRNFGVLLLLYIATYAAVLLLAMTFGGVSGFFIGLFFPAAVTSPFVQLMWVSLGAAIGHLLSPLPFIGIVLLYYDMRARKEAYDSAALAEDLMR